MPPHQARGRVWSRLSAIPPFLLPLPLVVLLALWTLLSAQLNGGRWVDVVATLGVCTVAYVAGLLTHQARAAIGPAAAAAVVAAFLVSQNAFSGAPLAGPLGYSNADAALLVQAAAAVGLAVAARTPNARLLGVGGAAGLVALNLVTGSAGGLITGAVVLAAVAVAASGYAPERSHVGVLLVLLVATPLLTVLMVTRPWLPGLDRATQALSQERVDLWNDALHLTAEHPWTGTGPATFSQKSRVASLDSDTRAAHSAPLEVGAELGLVGLALLAGVVVAVAFAVRSTAATDPETALIAAAAWLALWMHASIDYVANFPAVLMAACFVVGLSSSSTRVTSHSAAAREQHAEPA